ncbi:hypothetical protein [Nitrosopumilus sp.]|uniref:hypothetical protein n=1 Tax=Nitrosopumilus sp. TaxID=2024843 RepID=UPI00263097E6|nr:hypothetical protein [Nitrosopumilus sp.]
MDEKSRYHVYKLEREKDLFCSVLNVSGTGSANIYQIEDSDYFYSAYYFSDGNLTDVNLYYIRSKMLQDLVARKGNVIRFQPGTGEWDSHQGELKDIYCWLFVLRIMFSSAKEIKEIYKLEEDYERGYRIKQLAITE